MAEWCKSIFENMIDRGKIIYITKVESGQESRAFHTKEWWIIQNGSRQQTMKMFDNYRSIDGDEKTTWRTIKMSFCNWNHVEEDIRCEILWPTLYKDDNDYYRSCDACQRIGGLAIQKSSKASHKSCKGTIYEMGT
jgi:hypothetical protein